MSKDPGNSSGNNSGSTPEQGPGDDPASAAAREGRGTAGPPLFGLEAARRLLEKSTTADPQAGLYPHDTHPGLVPGISVDEQRNRFSLDKSVFSITAILVLAFIVWGVSNPGSVSETSSTMFAWAMTNMGWLLNFVMLIGLATMIYIGLSRYGRIKLGTDDDEPEFSRFSWIAMMFGAGIGVGIFFFGPSEPLWHYLSPPPHTVEGETVESLHQALAQSHFHWGLSAWGLYALVGGSLAYSSYRRGRVTLISSAFRSLFGPRTEGVAGRLIDIMAIIATLFGTAATLGLSAIQIGQGVQIISGASETTNTLLVLIIAILTIAFILSAVAGVAKGIRYLSNINITLTLGLVLFVFLTGPTLFLLNLIPSGVLEYGNQFLSMAGKSLSWGEETIAFQSSWTAFYWAWWIAWTPFVGMFIARISRGRTLREFAVVTIAVPTFILILAFTVFGGTAISMNRNGVEGFDGSNSSEQVLFDMFGNLPLSSVTPFLLIFVLAVFFITSADSASIVMGTMSSQGNPSPNKLVSVFWGLCMMGIAIVMLLAGGETALTALQNLTILIAIPFSAVLIVMCVAFIRDLATDPAAIRHAYARAAVSNAVVRGLEEHGDDFELAVEPAEEGRGAGAEFDSTSDRLTEWYQRTDEEGNDVDYDYSTGEWADGWTPESTPLDDASTEAPAPGEGAATER